ncbi:M20 family metallopeptidase [Paramaledivibacter caminithermalis]|uniref:Amidohydrolase n=1 Tax=Paramaledivibacter caminithermalis (strain DSM 15212 / CIP 107654 / DViRD3) TaxID=1121301 RepID=A0A1M6SHZ7_PARC5|nr:M20 family metallopeptidase [Paramaledivibacter caminithermalis]SHK44290.1 amidohydrolase [Paramaledivibacter caminithermalis DSM 15212]
MNIKELAKKYKQYAIDLRREFHMNPEPSMKEERTSDRVVEELTKMGIECSKVAGTGVVGIIRGSSEGKTIALRADMDALEVNEENDKDYKSKTPGIMHACGHDGHTAGLLTAAKILNDIKAELSGTVKLFFQPGEEVAQGAKKMIEEGVMEGVNGVFGIHLWNDIDAGKVSIEAGPRMASAGIFKIDVIGKGGHGSMPNQGIDAVVVGSSIVMNLQSLVSREINPLDPAVISIGMFNAGTRFNVIAGKAHLEGTTRCFSMEINNSFEEMITRVAENTAKSYRAEVEVDYKQLVIPTINNPQMSAIGEKAVEKIRGKDALITFEKTTGGEDFSFFTEKTPGVFAFVGSRNDKKLEYFPHHHPKFDIDEDALEVASALYAQFAVDFLEKF